MESQFQPGFTENFSLGFHFEKVAVFEPKVSSLNELEIRKSNAFKTWSMQTFFICNNFSQSIYRILQHVCENIDLSMLEINVSNSWAKKLKNVKM